MYLDALRLLESSTDPGLWMGSSWTCAVRQGQALGAVSADASASLAAADGVLNGRS